MASLSDDISIIDRNCMTLSRFAELSRFIWLMPTPQVRGAELFPEARPADGNAAGCLNVQPVDEETREASTSSFHRAHCTHACCFVLLASGPCELLTAVSMISRNIAQSETKAHWRLGDERRRSLGDCVSWSPGHCQWAKHYGCRNMPQIQRCEGATSDSVAHRRCRRAYRSPLHASDGMLPTEYVLMACQHHIKSAEPAVQESRLLSKGCMTVVFLQHRMQGPLLDRQQSLCHSGQYRHTADWHKLLRKCARLSQTLCSACAAFSYAHAMSSVLCKPGSPLRYCLQYIRMVHAITCYSACRLTRDKLGKAESKEEARRSHKVVVLI